MLFVFIVFILLIIILNFWLYRPILDFMAKREEMFSSETSKLDEEKGKIARLHKEAQELIANARHEARIIRELANKEAGAKYEESFERAKNEIEARFIESKKILDEQRSVLREELVSKIPLFQQEIENRIKEMEILK